MGNDSSIPAGHLPWGKECQNAAVDHFQIRRDKVRDIIRTQYDDNFALFAGALDIDPTTVSRWFSVKKGSKRIGDINARRIEKRLRLQPGDLDKPAFDAAAATNLTDGWPFKFDRRRFEKLDSSQRRKVETLVEGLILQFEVEAGTSTIRKKSKAG